MALLIAAADGNFTTAATWGVVSSGTGAITTTTGNTQTVTASYVYGTAFTGTNTDVVDGVALFVGRVSGSPSGTFTVALSDDNGVTATREVTVNASDFPTASSWMFFKFGSTLTLDGGTDYRIGVKSSVSSQVLVWRTSTANDPAHLLRTTAAPGSVAAGDVFFIMGEYTAAATYTARTVTMNSTAATDYGSAAASSPVQGNHTVSNGLEIGYYGTLTWASSAATNYILRMSGNISVWGGGTYNQGTTGTPCPRDSTMLLEFDCAADGDFGFLAFDGSTVNIQGQSRTAGNNTYWTLLNTDEAIASTSLGVADDTGWLDNDRIAVASTTRTNTQCEAGTLNGAAGASTLTVDGFAGAGGGLAFAHSGTAPTQAEVILLTRNVRIVSVSTTNMTYCFFNTTAIADIDWCEFRYLGDNATSKRGIDLTCTTGPFNMQYCSVGDCEDLWLNIQNVTQTSDIVVSNNVFWNCTVAVGTGSAQIHGSGTPVVTNNIFMLSAGEAVRLWTVNSTFTGNRIIGGGNGTLTIVGGTTNLGTISNNVIHSGTNTLFNISGGNGFEITISNTTLWRTSSTGLGVLAQRSNIIFDGLDIFGCGTGIDLASSKVTFIDCAVNGDTSFSTTTGLSITNNANASFINADFSSASGILTAATTDVSVVNAVSFVDVSFNNSKFVAATELANQSNMQTGSIITSSKHDQTAGAYKAWKRGGTIERDTTIFNTAAPSERLTPLSASVKLVGGSRLVGVDNAATKTINVYVRKSVVGDGAAYNGNQPRLILKRNDAVGITSDTVLDTMTAATGTWEQLTGTTAAATDDGAFEVYVDCDGTAGWVNVDDWSVS